LDVAQLPKRLQHQAHLPKKRLDPASVSDTPAEIPHHECTDLSVTAEHVVQSLEGQGIVVVRDAKADMDRVVRIELRHVRGRESELVRAAKALGAPIACLEARQYLAADYEEAVAEANKIIDTATRESRLRELKQFEQYIGQLCQFEVQAIGNNGGVAIVYRVTACWHDQSAFATPVDQAAFAFTSEKGFMAM
jgi:hypothetical protein